MTDAEGTSRPVVKLRPGKGRRLAAGAPWIYADEIAMDRRTKALAPGTLARLQEGDHVLGLVAVNPESQIAGRLLDRDADAAVDRAWFRDRLIGALRLRRMVLAGKDARENSAEDPAAFCRLVHAEGDGLPGLVIDRFGTAVVVQPNAAWVEGRLEALIGGLDDAFDGMAAGPVETIVINAQSRVRRLEGLDQRLEVVRGVVEGPLAVPMNGACYLADLTGGQKTGLFYDQRPNHRLSAGIGAAMAAEGLPATALDVFAHVGGFGLAMLAASPALSVTAVDSSEPALALAAAGAERMGVAARYETRRADAFDAMAAAHTGGERYGMVVCDPPAFAPHKAALEAGLRAYEKTARLAARLVAPGGWLVLCSCSGAVSAEALREASAKGMRAAGRGGALVHVGRAGPDHPQHMALPETGYLKALFFRLDG
ncbi:MAG: class I SAM-dependent methyltransferase [Pseudomonadota bacterium]